MAKRPALSKHVRWLCGLIVALSISGAFAQEIRVDSEVATPATAQASASPDAVAATGRLVVYRINAYPTLRTPKVMVDDKLMFRPKQKTYAEMDLPAGRHHFVVNWAFDTGWPDLEFDIEVKPGETTYVQISGSWTRVGPYTHEAGSIAYEVDPVKGAEDVRTCCKRLPTR